MNDQFIKNYNIVKQINTKINSLRTSEVYSQANSQLELLQLRIESLVIAVHINEHDYLSWKKNIIRNLSNLSQVVDKNQKPVLREIKTLINELFKTYDKAYIISKPHQQDAEDTKGV